MDRKIKIIMTPNGLFDLTMEQHGAVPTLTTHGMQENLNQNH
jgi:hypothetical protein